jgi:hypothetical protein
MNKWISITDKNGIPQALCAPDGTMIVMCEDKDIIFTSEGYKIQMNLFPPEFVALEHISNYKGKQTYEKLMRRITNAKSI